MHKTALKLIGISQMGAAHHANRISRPVTKTAKRRNPSDSTSNPIREA